MPHEELTEDSLFGGALVCRQHRRGYRFSVDAVLLANFVSPRKDARILDLGAGCGIVSLLLACRHPAVRLTALELQDSLADLCRGNVAANGLTERIVVLQGDLCLPASSLAAESFDLVVANPPYRKLLTGRRNPGEEQSIARHEVRATLKDFLAAAAFAVKNRGRVALVYPAARLSALLRGLHDQGLEPKRLQVVYGYRGGPARLVLVEAVKNGGEELEVLVPFYVYREAGGRKYTAAMQRYYKPIVTDAAWR